uniref:Disease resistance R13L4/SHOC-2-like LRR domain-containing protein n=1 Tax=Nelumbo nucifera TaxID=4432 RepID=A0A822Z273_NELNU|nr:TPA_asm: hypothetical protein HUJ06_013455 [Nelumbo nucifera]
MHDIVRDVAISMASDDSHHEVFLGRAGRGLTEYPIMESSERYTAISLISNSIWKLPNRSGLCPKLRVLLLQENRGLTEIADTFFEGMESLRVLDLSRTQVERFPPSIRCLTNLRTLHFVTNKQYLVDISMIGELKKLVILSLRSCLLSSAELPENIAHLTNLRMLDLSDSTQGANLVNVISGLYQLEELYLKLGGDLPDDFVFQGFVRFNIWINYMTSSYCTGTAAELYENTPHTLCLGDLSAERLKTLCSRLWKNTELLCLERCNDLKSMKELYEGGFGKLKHLCLQKCESLRSIFSLAEAQSLPQLEELSSSMAVIT